MHRHKCDERCFCHIHNLPLYYSRAFNQHACQNIDCKAYPSGER